MSTFTIRPATADDAEGIARVRVRSWQAGYRGQVPDDILDAMDPAEEARQVAARLAEPRVDVGIHVAVDPADTVLGFVIFAPYRIGDSGPDRPIHPTEGEIRLIYNDPDHWGRGIGQALMATALRELATQGRHTVRLWVLRTNVRARRFYERAGFVFDGETSVFRIERGGDPPVELDEIRYVRDGRPG